MRERKAVRSWPKVIDSIYGGEIPRQSDFVGFNETDNTFHIGQVYEKNAATTVFCKRCHGTEFNVGVGSYYTAIRCTHCKWELMIHEG